MHVSIVALFTSLWMISVPCTHIPVCRMVMITLELFVGIPSTNIRDVARQTVDTIVVRKFKLVFGMQGSCKKLSK